MERVRERSGSGRVHTVAHGKILWLGGYSVLERPNISYVTTVDAGVHAYLDLEQDDSITIEAPQFNMVVRGNLDRSTAKISMNEPKEMRLVKTSVQAALMYAKSRGANISGFRIKTENDPAFSYRVGEGEAKLTKSGLGSSAAVTVASVGAVLSAFGIDLYESDALHKISQTAHAVATGKVGSGFDIAAASYGDIIYSRYDPNILRGFQSDFTVDDISAIVRRSWDYKIESMPLPSAFDLMLANFINKAAITVSMVGSVNQFKAEHPDSYSDMIKEMNARNTDALNAMRKIVHDGSSEESFEDFKSSFDEARYATKRLGELSNVIIEPDDATELIEESERHGAFVAKLPGAGGYDSIAALIRKDRDDGAASKLSDFWSRNRSLQMLHVKRRSVGIEVL